MRVIALGIAVTHRRPKPDGSGDGTAVDLGVIWGHWNRRTHPMRVVSPAYGRYR